LHLEQLVKDRTAELEKARNQAQEALANIKSLKALLPICSCCMKIRDDEGYWNQVDSYISQHTDSKFSHSICPECAKKIYPDLTIDFDKIKNKPK